MNRNMVSPCLTILALVTAIPKISHHDVQVRLPHSYAYRDGIDECEDHGAPLTFDELFGLRTIQEFKGPDWHGTGDVAISIDEFEAAKDKVAFTKNHVDSLKLNSDPGYLNEGLTKYVLDPSNYQREFSIFGAKEYYFDTVIKPRELPVYLLFNTRCGVCAIVDLEHRTHFFGLFPVRVCLSHVAYIRAIGPNNTWHVGKR